MSRLRLASAALIAAFALPVQGASGSAYSRVLNAYEQSGTIAPCAFSSAELSRALEAVDTYGAQYLTDFTDAINSALASRASGQCAAQATPAKPPSGAGVETPGGHGSNVPLQVGPLIAATGAGPPLPIVLMALVALSAALVAALTAVARGRGWDPVWAARWRHACSEAGYRAGGVWSDFVDWLRSR